MSAGELGCVWGSWDVCWGERGTGVCGELVCVQLELGCVWGAGDVCRGGARDVCWGERGTGVCGSRGCVKGAGDVVDSFLGHHSICRDCCTSLLLNTTLRFKKVTIP